MENICYQKQFIYDKLHNRMICDEIMNIITEYNIPRTINKNGIFINVSVLSEEVIQLLSLAYRHLYMFQVHSL